MNCFLFIFMITLTVVTSNPDYDLSYKEIVELVNNFNSLKKENEKCKGLFLSLYPLLLCYGMVYVSAFGPDDVVLGWLRLTFIFYYEII